MQRSIRFLSVAVSAVILFGPAAYGQQRELDVLCGGSFRSPMEELASQFKKETGTQINLVFGQSEDHLPKVKMQAAGDVFVSHDPYLDYTREADALAGYELVGFVAPVLVTAEGNPKDVKRIEDLTRPGLRVVLTNPDYSTCGEMTFELLEKKGIKDEVLKNVGNAQVRSHAQVATLIKLGHRDAGIMWNGVAHNWLKDIDIIPTPYEYEEEIRVSIMGLSYSERPKLVKQFLDFVGEHGKETFREYGYVKVVESEEDEDQEEKAGDQE